MARAIEVTQTGVGSSDWLPLNIHITPFAIGFGVVVDGVVDYTVQHTFDDVQDPSVTPVAFDHDTVASLTANEDGNYAFPVRAIRITVNSGAGSVRFRSIQAGIKN